MQTSVVNPYAALGDKQVEALEFIIANLPGSPTFDQFNSVLLTAIFGSEPDNILNDFIAPVFLFAVLPTAYNTSLNHTFHIESQYSENQAAIINRLLQGIQSNSLTSLPDYVGLLEQEMAANGQMSPDEKLPLYLAMVLAKSQAVYWNTQITAPGLWAPYLNPDNTLNYMQAPNWISASVYGLLYSYGQVPATRFVLPALFPALIGAIGLSTGKVVFGWVG